MKRKICKCFVLVFMSAVLLSLTSCGGGGGGDGYHAPPHALTGTIELNNHSIATFDDFYLAPTDQTFWGPNILAGSVFPGEQTFIDGISTGYYDAKIMAAGAYSDYFGYLYDIPIAAGDTVPLNVYNSSFTGSLEIHNNTLNAYIVGIYVVPANSTTWGANQASSLIEPSGLLHLTDFTPDFYDVRVVWTDGPDSIYYDTTVDSLTLTTLNAD